MRKILTASAILATLGLVVACGPGQARSEKGMEKVELKFPQEFKNENQNAVEGVTYTTVSVESTPFKGIFSPLHYTDASDSAIVAYFAEEIFFNNEDFEVNDVEGGMATLHINTEKKQIEIKFRDGLKWSDGEPLGVDDFIFTAEVLGSPEYTGVRYNPAEHGLIEGMTEYHEGKAKTISGIEKVSDTEVIIHLKENSPKVITGGGPVSSLAMLLPKHYLQDVAVKDLETSDKIRKNPLSYGQYVISNIVPGETVEFVPNEYYYLGKPKMAKVIYKTITSQLVLESMKNGEYFGYSGVPSDLYDKYKDLGNFEVLGRPALSYTYLGYNLGHYDKEKGENVQDRDTPLQDVKVRQALAYALNIDEAASAFYHGLKERANGVTPPIFSKYYDADLKGYPYNPEKAKELLAEAGYKDTDGDGIVDKDGKKLSLKLAFMNGSDVLEPLAKFLMQNWAEVGVEIELTTGRLLDPNLLYQKVEANEDDVDIWSAGWSVGTSLDPSHLTSRTAEFNFYRFVSEENDKLLAAIADPKGLEDPNYKAEAYKTWQRYWIDQAPLIPLMFSYGLTPINKSVKYANVYVDSKRSTYITEVVNNTPAKADIK